MQLLITCPRAPVTLEWIKIAQRSGHRVTLVDSLRFPMAGFMPDVTYQRIASPRLDFAQYQRQITALIEQADYIIPTCEDIFYLAQLPLSATERKKIFMPNHKLLLQLHHKQDFFTTLNSHVKCPETTLITDKNSLIADEEREQKTILKPVYSRFGRSVIRGVPKANLSAIKQNIMPTESQPWVQQAFIAGEPVCNYAVCEYGTVIAHAMYRPKYLLNQSAATYFEPLFDPRCQAFIEQFAADNHYHGQVAFDFIDDGDNLWVLECNPRATSGLHLIGQNLQLSGDGQLSVTGNPTQQAHRIGASLPLLFTLDAVKKRQFNALIHDYNIAKDVTADLPCYASGLAFAEMLWRSLRYRQPLTSASTFDIEYDND